MKEHIKKNGAVFMLLVAFIALNAPDFISNNLTNIMADPVWGALAKAQDNNETIEEAIVRLITAHEADAGAHTGSGESLETHKTQDIVDHPAGSIVSDKIPAGQLSLEQYSYERYVTQIDIEDLCINKYSGSAFGGSLYGELQASAVIDDWETATVGGDEAYNLIGDETKDPMFRFRLEPSITANFETYFGIGNFLEDSALGFKIVDGDVYGVWWDTDPVEHLIDLNFTLSGPHSYSLETLDGEFVKWYIDGVLMETLTWSGSDIVFEGGNWGLTLSLRKRASGGHVLLLYQLLFEQDFV